MGPWLLKSFPMHEARLPWLPIRAFAQPVYEDQYVLLLKTWTLPSGRAILNAGQPVSCPLSSPVSGLWRIGLQVIMALPVAAASEE